MVFVLREGYHVDVDDQCYSLGCIEQPDCLRIYNQCPRLAAILGTFCRYAGIQLRHDLLLHDLSTQTAFLNMVFLSWMHTVTIVRTDTSPRRVRGLSARTQSPNGRPFTCIDSRIAKCVLVEARVTSRSAP